MTAALGHASAVTTLRHYTHLFDDAQLAPMMPMVDAITAARAAMAEEDVPGLFPHEPSEMA